MIDRLNKSWQQTSKGSQSLADLRFRQDTLNGLLLFFMVAIPFIEIVYWLITLDHDQFSLEILTDSIILFFLILCLYFINHRGYSNIAGYILIGAVMSTVFSGLLSFPPSQRSLFNGYLILPILLTSLLFGKRYILLTASVEIAIMVWISFSFPNIELIEMPIFLVLVTAGLLIFISDLRTRAQRDRERLKQEEEHQIRLMIEPTAETTIVYDHVEQVVTRIQQHTLNLLVFGSLELVGQDTAPDLKLPIQLPQEFGDHIQQSLGGNLVTFEIPLRHLSGEMILCEVRMNRLPIEDRQLLQITIRDMRPEHKNARALQAYTQRLEALHRIDSAILEATSSTQVAEAALKNLQGLIEFDRASITVYESEIDDTYYYLLAVAGTQQDVIPRFTRHKLVDTNFLQELRENQEEVYNPDIAQLGTPNSSQQVLIDAGQHSVLNVPIIVQDQVTAALNVSSSKVDVFEEQDIENARAVARQISIALRQTGLLESLEERARQLEAVRNSSLGLTQSLELEDVLQAILKATLVLVGSAQFAHLCLYREGKFIQDVARDIDGNQDLGLPPPRPGGFTEHIATIREIDWLENIAESLQFKSDNPDGWEGTLVGLPLLIGDEVVGVMNIYFPEPRSFNLQQTAVLRLVSDHAAIAIQNARLFEAERNARSLQNAIFQTSQSLSSSLSVETVFETLLEESRKLLPMVSSNILRYEDEQITLAVMKSWDGFKNTASNKEVQSLGSGSIVRKLIEEKRAIIVNDVEKEPSWVAIKGAEYIKSWMGIPLVAGGEFIGTWNLDHSEPGTYTQEHLRIAQSLASAVASAVQNARLFEAERRARVLQDAIASTSQSMSSTLNVEEVFETLLEGSQKILPFVSSSILRYDQGRVSIVAFKTLRENHETKNFQNWQKVAEGSILQQLIQTQEPIVLGDVREEPGWIKLEETEFICSWMGIPLVAGGQFIGTWNLDHDQVHVYTPEHLRIAQSLAAPLAGAIQNARLFEAQQLALGQTNTLLDLTQSVTSSLELNKTLDQFLSGSQHIIEYTSSMIISYRNDRFYPIAMAGFEDEERVVRYFEKYQNDPEGIPLFHELITRREPLLIRDVIKFHAWKHIAELPDVLSWIGVPLFVRGDFIGVWMLDQTISNYYNEDHLRLATALAGPAAIAIQNAQFYQQQGRYAEELEQRVQERTQALQATNKELESFAYSVSHDLRAPLRAMDGFATILREDYLDQFDDQGKLYLRRIIEAAERMDNLINDLLIYSRISREEIHLAPVLLEPLLQEVTTLLESEITNRQAEIEIQSPLPTVLGQRSVIQQVLTNLVSNGIKFQHQDSIPHVTVRGVVENGNATVFVADNGIGISNEHQERIFQVFERLHGVESYPGTGIGLAIVKKGIERLGGQVGVKSKLEEGSEFWFKLPTAELKNRD